MQEEQQGRYDAENGERLRREAIESFGIHVGYSISSPWEMDAEQFKKIGVAFVNSFARQPRFREDWSTALPCFHRIKAIIAFFHHRRMTPAEIRQRDT
jgi:hypothetical protein